MLDAPGLLGSCDLRTSEEPLGFFTPWRLSGLLSGYLPTDTRPQARAKLGKSAHRWFESASQHFFSPRDDFPQRVAASPLATRASDVEHERLLSFFKEV